APLGFRLVSSGDGVTWHTADDALAAVGQVATDIALSPTGATIYAATAASSSDPLVDDRQLWRSDDAGAHWTHTGSLPAGQSPPAPLIAVGQLLYAMVFDQGNAHTHPLGFQATADGGRTWTDVPTAGIASGLEV